MTPDEMREQADWAAPRDDYNDGHKLALLRAALWGVAAEVCERLDRLADLEAERP